MLELIRNELNAAGVREVPAEGSFSLADEKPKLFPGGVYGFFVELTEEDALLFFNEALNRHTASIDSYEVFKPIKDSIYPIYWGKDKSIGKRPYEHLRNPVGTGSIRLSTYKSLVGKMIQSVALVVDDNKKFEIHLQQKYPHLLLTKTAQYNEI